MYLVAVSADEDRFLRFLFKKFCARVMLFFQTIERTRAPAQKSACCIEQEGQPDWQLPVMRERERKRVRVCMHMTVVLPVSFRYRKPQQHQSCLWLFYRNRQKNTTATATLLHLHIIQVTPGLPCQIKLYFYSFLTLNIRKHDPAQETA